MVKSDSPSLDFLPEDFVPSPNEVIVGRGKKCTNHSGNKRLKGMVYSMLQEYSTANDKTHKTYIISQIFQEIRQTGTFVKKDNASGRWYRVKDPCARTNIAQCFRDALHDDYRSSKFSKQRRRWFSLNPPQEKPRQEAQPKQQPVLATKTPENGMHMTPNSVSSMMSAPSTGLQFMLRYQVSQPPVPLQSTSMPFNEGTSNIRDVLSAALDVIDRDEEIMQVPRAATSFSFTKTQDEFDSLFSVSFTPTDEYEAVGNPFEPTPIAEGVLSA